MLTIDLRNILYWKILLCVDTLKGHMNVENWVKEHIHIVCGIDRHTSVFMILHTHRSQWLLWNKTTHLMSWCDSHISWRLSICNQVWILPAHDSLEGLPRHDATLRGCRLLQSPRRRVCAFHRWHRPLSCLPRQKTGWVPQGTGWGCHSIWTWTGRGNSDDQLQQTKQNPTAENFHVIQLQHLTDTYTVRWIGV